MCMVVQIRYDIERPMALWVDECLASMMNEDFLREMAERWYEIRYLTRLDG